MDARITILCCTVFLAICSASAHQRWFPQSDSEEQRSDGVCTYTQLEYTYKWVNQSYPCCKQKLRSSCHGTRRFRRWSDFHLRDFGLNCACSFLPADRCFYVVSTTCFKHVRVCTARRVLKKYCCSGYTPDARGKCTEDADDYMECRIKNGGCEQICRCQNWRPVCSCLPGYVLDGPRKCRDINECAVDNGKCQHECHNVNGSYYCSCHPGFVLTTRYNCTEMAMTTPTVVPTTTTVIPTTTTAFREPLGTAGIDSRERVGSAEKMLANDGEEKGHKDSRVAVIAGSLAGLLCLVLLALLIFALVRCGYCCCCFCCGAAADEKKTEPAQAYDNAVYEDLAACVSARVEKPTIYDNVVEDTQAKKKPIDNQVYDNCINHDLYAAGVASANPAVNGNVAADANQTDNDDATAANAYVDMK